MRPSIESRLTPLLIELRAELLAKDAKTLRRDRDGARAGDATDPAVREALAAELRRDRSGEMRPPFAPVEAWPAQHARGAPPATLHQVGHVDPDPVEERDARIRDHAAIAGEFRMVVRDQRVRQRDAEPP